MGDTKSHEIELYAPDLFDTLLKHEVNKSRRYGGSLTLLYLSVAAQPNSEATQHGAELVIINALNIHLRDTDIPCKLGNEFHILMTSTSAPGARTACERLRKLVTSEQHTYEGTPFAVSVFSGMDILPIDHTLSAREFADRAAKALHYAQTHQLNNVAVFSEIYK